HAAPGADERGAGAAGAGAAAGAGLRQREAVVGRAEAGGRQSAGGSGAAGESDDRTFRGGRGGECRGNADGGARADRRPAKPGDAGAAQLGGRGMKGRGGLIVALRGQAGGGPLWMRVVDGAVVQRGTGAN